MSKKKSKPAPDVYPVQFRALSTLIEQDKGTIAPRKSIMTREGFWGHLSDEEFEARTDLLLEAKVIEVVQLPQPTAPPDEAEDN